jgi:hypothetical protein
MSSSVQNCELVSEALHSGAIYAANCGTHSSTRGELIALSDHALRCVTKLVWYLHHLHRRRQYSRNDDYHNSDTGSVSQLVRTGKVTILLTYLRTYLLHAAESFLKS